MEVTAVFTCEAWRIADTEHGEGSAADGSCRTPGPWPCRCQEWPSGQAASAARLLRPVTILILPDQCDTSKDHIDRQEATIPCGLEVGHGQAIVDLSLEPG